MSDTATHSDARKIVQSVTEAQNVLAEYNHYLLRATGTETRPTQHPEVRALKVELHTAMMTAYQRMRHYIKTRLTNTYWRIDITDLLDEEGRFDRTHDDWEHWMRALTTREDECVYAGLFVLDEFQAPIEARTQTREYRDSGKEERTTYHANLADREFYEAVINVLGECMIKLGLGADVSVDDGDAGFEYEDILEEGPPEEPDIQPPEAAGD